MNAADTDRIKLATLDYFAEAHPAAIRFASEIASAIGIDLPTLNPVLAALVTENAVIDYVLAGPTSPYTPQRSLPKVYRLNCPPGELARRRAALTPAA